MVVTANFEYSAQSVGVGTGRGGLSLDGGNGDLPHGGRSPSQQSLDRGQVACHVGSVGRDVALELVAASDRLPPAAGPVTGCHCAGSPGAGRGPDGQ